jgi:hypothetical protein
LTLERWASAFHGLVRVTETAGWWAVAWPLRVGALELARALELEGALALPSLPQALEGVNESAVQMVGAWPSVHQGAVVLEVVASQEVVQKAVPSQGPWPSQEVALRELALEGAVALEDLEDLEARASQLRVSQSVVCLLAC